MSTCRGDETLIKSGVSVSYIHEPIATCMLFEGWRKITENRRRIHVLRSSFSSSTLSLVSRYVNIIGMARSRVICNASIGVRSNSSWRLKGKVNCKLLGWRSGTPGLSGDWRYHVLNSGNRLFPHPTHSISTPCFEEQEYWHFLECEGFFPLCSSPNVRLIPLSK
jgi:hypothetical protein